MLFVAASCVYNKLVFVQKFFCILQDHRSVCDATCARTDAVVQEKWQPQVHQLKEKHQSMERRLVLKMSEMQITIEVFWNASFTLLKQKSISIKLPLTASLSCSQRTRPSSENLPSLLSTRMSISWDFEESCGNIFVTAVDAVRERSFFHPRWTGNSRFVVSRLRFLWGGGG